MPERVRIDVVDHVATVAVARPERHNALDGEMSEAITGAAERLRSEPGLRVVVLCGEGRSFCSGLDLMSIAATGQGVDGLTRPLRAEVPNWYQRAAYDWIR